VGNRSERRLYLKDIRVLDTNEDVEALADVIATELQIPPKARIDAFHISMAAVHGIQFLLTWNWVVANVMAQGVELGIIPLGMESESLGMGHR
jgi:hypothetical protein